MKEKPPYVVPTMEEVAKIRGTNGYKVVSTFSGCGGACLGFEMDGYDVVWANEFIPEAQTTYRLNHPETILDTRDIRTVHHQDILDAIGMQVGELDVFEGSPPCASFSTSGKREKAWGQEKQYSDTVQRADDLFFEYARLLRGLQPKTFTAENVTGLVKGKAIGYFKLILTELRSAGYHVTAQVLDASYLGVPQARQRVIFVGVRNDLAKKYGVAPAHPKPLGYRYTVADVLPSVQRIKLSGKPHNYQSPTRPAPTITSSDGQASPTAYFSGGGWLMSADEITHDPETGHKIALGDYAVGKEWDRLAMGQMTGRKYLNFYKPDPNKPVGTITATGGQVGAASVAHPTQRRKFTLEELRLLSSFPADFELTGTFEQRWERIGRSVPPLMARAIAHAMRTEMLDKMR